MPYIKKENKNRFEIKIDGIGINEGELNYLITTLCLYYLESNKESYSTYNSIIGALECAKIEMYRRKISLYEDRKIKENGDVF